MADQKCLVACLGCSGPDDTVVVPFSSYVERDEWATAHARATRHTVVGFHGWPTLQEVRAALTSNP